jgi:hypothetical protein
MTTVAKLFYLVLKIRENILSVAATSAFLACVSKRLESGSV